MTAQIDIDQRWMAMAIGLARRGLGNVWPNPAVGCVIVHQDRVLSVGWTQHGGRPHAESVALAYCAESARGATAYVTLEPCSHIGQTPPCADALIAAGVARVVIGVNDPDPRVAGRGVERLRAAGIAVVTGVMEAACSDGLGGYLMRCHYQRPLMAMKTATSLDGKIALANGQSKWITGPQARQFGHLLRAKHDAILVGMGTIRADNPGLDCRLPGMNHHSPRVIVIDPEFTIDIKSNIFIHDKNQIVIGNNSKNSSDRCNRLIDHGVDIIKIDSNECHRLDPTVICQELAKKGLTSVLIEGGAHTQTAFLRVNQIDHIWWFRGAMIMGGDAKSCNDSMMYHNIVDIAHWHHGERHQFDHDLVDFYKKQGTVD